MKQSSDKFTIDAFDKPVRGRPISPYVKSTAQLQRGFFPRQKFNFLVAVKRSGNSKEVNQ